MSSGSAASTRGSFGEGCPHGTPLEAGARPPRGPNRDPMIPAARRERPAPRRAAATSSADIRGLNPLGQSHRKPEPNVPQWTSTPSSSSSLVKLIELTPGGEALGFRIVVQRIVSFFAEDATFYLARGPEPVGRTLRGKATIRKALGRPLQGDPEHALGAQGVHPGQQPRHLR